MAENGEYSVSRLRWRVRIAKRRHVAGAWAEVAPLGGLTFWNSAQTDSPITHHIVLRWVDYLDNTYAILRTTKRPDGQLRNEVFRVRRVGEEGGRKRFTILDVELEAVA